MFANCQCFLRCSRFNHWLGGLRPFGYHLGNTLLHGVVTLLFAHVARLLLRRSVPTAVAGLLFAAHPIHTEAVAGVVGRADILACLFFLLAFLCYMRYCKYRDKPGGGSRFLLHLRATHHNGGSGGRHSSSPSSRSSLQAARRGVPLNTNVRWLYLIATAALTAASMLSKEQGITVLAVCATYDLFLHSRISVRQLPAVLKVKSLLSSFQRPGHNRGTKSVLALCRQRNVEIYSYLWRNANFVLFSGVIGKPRMIQVTDLSETFHLQPFASGRICCEGFWRIFVGTFRLTAV